MKICPRCRQEPFWLSANNTTVARKAIHHIYCACNHFKEIVGTRTPVPNMRKLEMEEQSDALAEKLFAEMTAHLSDVQRTAFHDQLYPPHTGEPWEHHEWVKTTRLRLANQNGLFPEPSRHYSEPQETGGCPYANEQALKNAVCAAIQAVHLP